MAVSLSIQVRRFRQFSSSHTRFIFVIVIVILTILEIFLHVRSFDVPHSSEPLDPPFANSCRAASDPSVLFDPYASTPPPDAAQPRENATIFMLARNSDRDNAAVAIRSLEQQWNKHFHYPYVFLNDNPFDQSFISAVSAEVSGETVFEQIPVHMWSWPVDPLTGRETPSRHTAKIAMDRMAAQGLPHAQDENYHHMCRFYSGFFFDHPALAPYDWYWRLDPDVRYTCAIPYDPFRQMRLHKKVYGYVMALWEVGSTCPNLFRIALGHITRFSIPSSTAWRSLLEPSSAPWPIRRFLLSSQSLFHSRTPQGDPWSLCHFWSNFEIASLAFFRSPEYRRFFATLDDAGGFYTERWGDAPVHSLAASMLLRPEELHWFGDLGYVHPPLGHCPAVDGRGARGCGCDCEQTQVVRGVPQDCLASLRRAVEVG